MKKILLTVVASGALIALAPATALARHHHGHARVHHTRIHHRRIGDPAPTATSPTTTPSPAATVASFTGNVLTLTVPNGSGGSSTVSGMVTPNTQIDCVSSQTGTMQPSGEDQGDDQGDQSTGNGGGDQGGGNGGGDRMRAHDQGPGGGDDQGQGDDESNQSCTPAAGMQVQEADLSISSTGAAWDRVELITTPSTTAPQVADTDNDGN